MAPKRALQKEDGGEYQPAKKRLLTSTEPPRRSLRLLRRPVADPAPLPTTAPTGAPVSSPAPAPATTQPQPPPILPLTRRNLRRLQDMSRNKGKAVTEGPAGGKPMSSCTRSEGTPVQRPAKPTEGTATSERTASRTMTGFAEITAKNGQLMPMQSSEPTNLESKRRRLALSRASRSPDVEDFRDFAAQITIASGEGEIQGIVDRNILKFPERMAP